MSEVKEVIIIRDQPNEYAEDGVVVPVDRITPETLRKLIEEFVTREWSDLSDSDCIYEDKIEQVIQQLKEDRIHVVFDLTSETCNIVPSNGGLFRTIE